MKGARRKAKHKARREAERARAAPKPKAVFGGEVHKTPFASFVRSMMNLLSPRFPVCVCFSCVRPTDEVVATAGDFSLCDRCRASITSESGLAVRMRAA
jgi:hypothetical protein